MLSRYTKFITDCENVPVELVSKVELKASLVEAQIPTIAAGEMEYIKGKTAQGRVYETKIREMYESVKEVDTKYKTELAGK